MNKKSLFLAVLIFSLLLFTFSSYITSAFLITDTYRMKGEITTGGHVNLTNVSGGLIQNLSKIAIGQPIIGIASGGGYKICFGVFCTDVYQPQYSMNFTGILTYSNGSTVSNSPIKVTINYLGSQFEGKNWTDNSGIFFVKLDKLPEYMMNQDLNITIYVQGEIEAIHNCYYNHTESCCCKQPGPKSCKPCIS